MSAKLLFGLKNNRIVLVSDVDGGLKCRCVCPDCKHPLMARKGPKRAHHFSHLKRPQVEQCGQSTVHLAAKQIILERKKITLPECVVVVTLPDSKGVEHREKVTVAKAGAEIKFDCVKDEVELHGFKPDILGTYNQSRLIIEIFYRHRVDDQKKIKIEQANVSAIEINLSDLSWKDVISWETFWSCINDVKRIKWLYNARATNIVRPSLTERVKKTIQAQEIKYQQIEIESKKRAEKEMADLRHAVEIVKRLMSAEHVAELKQMAETHPALEKHCKNLPFSWHELPGFLNVVTPNGDWIFGCDRRVWQTAFYCYFVRWMGKDFSTKQVDEWLQNEAGCKVSHSAKIVGIYGKKYRPMLPPNFSASDLPLSWRTLNYYFKELSYLRILEFADKDWSNPGSNWYKVLSKQPIIERRRIHDPIRERAARDRSTPMSAQTKNNVQNEDRPATKYKVYTKLSVRYKL